MLDIKDIRQRSDYYQQKFLDRFISVSVEDLLAQDKHIRFLKTSLEEKRARLKKESKQMCGFNEDLKALSQNIKDEEKNLEKCSQSFRELMLSIPNIASDDVPVGQDEKANECVRSWGESPSFDFSLQDHVEILQNHSWVSFEQSAFLSGSGFPAFLGQGAQLIRALINFMLDIHTQNGYVEVHPPLLVRPEVMQGTGQLPKMKDDMYVCAQDDLYLIPTAEVPVTNLWARCILKEEDLPSCYVAYTPCFRREAGSYGKDTRGLARLHQFDKVELVHFCYPEDRYRVFDRLIADAESILQALGLHYRVLSLSTGDMSFAAEKCYDLEVWSPVQKKFLEVSSCSSFGQFQARRMQTRFKRSDRQNDFVATLNGSGVALPRLIIALLETYQNSDGTFERPSVLDPYFRFLS